MTEKLYYRDTGTIEFEADVVEAFEEKKRWAVVLGGTYFYPEGGGQPADKGWINDIPVTDVQKIDDIIYHYLPRNPLESGAETVRCKIDVDWRNDFMQQHTGQHVISGALWKIGEYKTLSVHMGTDYTTIEVDAPDVPENHLQAAEDLANRVILDDLALEAVLTDHTQLEKFSLRRPTSREGSVRLVRIGGFDCVACGGLHLSSTRHVGLVKMIGTEKIRGHARIAWKIGRRAMEDYREKDNIIAQLRGLLGTRTGDLPEKTTALHEELTALKRKAGQLENRLAEIMARSLREHASEKIEKGEKGDHDDHGDEKRVGLITVAWHEEDKNLVKKVVKNLLECENTLFCLVNTVGDRVQWSVGCSEGMDFDFGGLRDRLLPLIDGKGGGRAPLWQGTGDKTDGVGDFLAGFVGTVGV